MPRPTFDTSNGWWYYRYRDAAGNRVKQPLAKDHRWKGPGHKLATPPPDVLLIARKYQDIEIQARHGADVSAARPIPLRPFLTEYRESFAVAGKSPRSLVELDATIRDFLSYCDAEGIATVQAVNRAACRSYLESRACAGRKRKTLQKHAGMLGPAFAHAEAEGRIPRNPWARLPIPGRKRTEESPFWTEAECEGIAAQLEGWARDVFLIGIHSGFRVDGLRHLKWGDVLWTDPRSPLGSLWCRRAKGDKPYRIPLFPRLREVLERRKSETTATGPDDWIFPGRDGEPISRDAIDYQLEQAMKRAGVLDRGRRCHAMRETFGTRCGAKGVHPRTLMAWMNHTDLKITLKYLHYDINSEATEASKLDG